ncbi:prepilin-type N-terminal cleavage/methylation domain-containing protein [Coraliomargarita sp. SDUM461004]|uniref:Prepilin-type N-terminal cleavage/methylation domain-containing protein n=1 Tax=Thalassobacterium sedimentorum TaxID=3041258 RepID=A0ABU1AMW4_9BACT|nr:prepilin-type N-terminal cleavage/methylation domain-containing protein [Coraliomargarita sp. SDUM461004]MDQ8196134.1 prepilin-type N-terminal cleavage/methylation domain-containing protein [Coraliomargarita sp. SDUM461004]
MHGFTLIELLVVIAIIAILAAILISSLSSIRSRTSIAQSTSNLRQLGNAISLYALEHNNRVPPKLAPGTTLFSVYSWTGKRGSNGIYKATGADLRPLNYYLGITSPDDPCEIANYPSDESGNYDTYGSAYAANTTHPTITYSAQDLTRNTGATLGALMNDIASPSRFVLMAEKGGLDYAVWGALNTKTLNSKNQIAWNFLFADGHVEFVYPEKGEITTPQYTFDRKQ